jgi:hypothetical protein
MSRPSVVKGVLLGAAAGAAGTTALNLVTYLDMAVRGRPSSDTPERTAERAIEEVGVDLPGDEEAREHRLAGIGPLLGVVTGVGVGALLGGFRAAGWRASSTATAAVATAVALVGANTPMAALGVSDPRTWSATDWTADVVPHLAYGAVTAALLGTLDRG